jgi:hypothetical protein
MSDAPSLPFTPQQALEFMQRMWNPFGMPMPGFTPPATAGAAPAGMPYPNPAAMFATLDPAEIDKKIGELTIIENWLGMSQNFIQMSIKTLELQKASLEAMRGGAAAAGMMDPSRKRTRARSEDK